MSDAYASARLPFERRGHRDPWHLLQWMTMAADGADDDRRGGRFRTGHPGAGRSGTRGGGRGRAAFGGRFPGGPRARRGDVRASVLALLAEQPRNGYQIIQAIEEGTGGLWRPSAGAVYPALAQLEDERLVRARDAEDGAGRLFELTDDGRRLVEGDPERYDAPWEAVSDTGAGEAKEWRKLIGEMAAAAMQVFHAGSASQVGEARRILTDGRRSLYRVLAEGEPGDPNDDEPRNEPR